MMEGEVGCESEVHHENHERLLAGCGLLLVLSGSPAQEKAQPFEQTKEEVKILELTNLERKKDGKAALKLNAELSKIARAHSENMARQEKLEHKLDNKDIFDRARAAKFKYLVIGENIGYGEKGLTPAAMVKLWMDSKGHRENILFPEFKEIGIGIAHDKAGQPYFTEVFADPRPPRD